MFLAVGFLVFELFNLINHQNFQQMKKCKEFSNNIFKNKNKLRLKE